MLRDGETGRVLADGILATTGAAAISGSGSFAVNVAGEIWATSADAIRATSATSVTISVAEGGSITSAGGDAINLVVSGPVNIDNSGTVVGDIVIATSGSGRVVFDCRGTVDGDILVTNEVTDSFDLRSGQVSGIVSGGDGNDDYYVDSSDVRLFEAEGEGTADRIFTTISLVMPRNFEVINLLGSDEISATATEPDGVRMYGNNARNTLTGGAGNDWLQSNRGGDLLIGGAGSDTYYVHADDNIVERTNGGIDTVRLPGGYLGVDVYTLPQQVENLVNGSTGDLTVNGNVLNNTFSNYGSESPSVTFNGRGGDDTYITDGGDSIIERAEEGIDKVLSSVSLTLGSHLENLTLTGRANASAAGNSGDNVVIGNSGHNTLYGHGGTDMMTGGAGQDSFVFSASMRASNIDTIADFNTHNDTIRLSDAAFAALSEGALPASAFASNTTGQATDASDRIIYETDTGRLFYDSDGTGSAPRGHFATIAPGLSLSAADFIVF